MDNVDWAALSVLAMIVLGAVGYLNHRIRRVEDRLTHRFDQLEERYVRHLEAHAVGR